MNNTSRPITYTSIVGLSFPIILANAATPLLGLVDTAVISHTGNTQALGAIALGGLIFSFVYWAFGFLRMSTTGFVAQAIGANNRVDARVVYSRAWLVGMSIGLLLLFLQYPLIEAALFLFDASEGVEALTHTYWDIRIWGAPATLTTYAIIGTLIGLGKTRALLYLQLVLNSVNLVLDITFVTVFDMGVEGIALGTVIAEFTTAVIGFFYLKHLLSDASPFWLWPLLRNWHAISTMLKTNSDIFWRTLSLLLGFGLFVQLSAGFGDDVLAATHILLQVISFSAFFLDGFAFSLESMVGYAIGAKQRHHFDIALRKTWIVSGVCALLLAALVILAGPWLLTALSTTDAVYDIAIDYRYWAALYIALSFSAFVLDGVFIGATRSRDMRNAALISLAAFALSCVLLAPLFEMTGVWLAFVLYVVIRALTLGHYLANIRNALVPSTSSDAV
jgi:MATE family multidrug resistance protein